ncbi:MAG: radical SAM protein [bacterium]
MKAFLFITPYSNATHPSLGIGYCASYVNKFYHDSYNFYHVDYALQNDSHLETMLQKIEPDCIGITSTTESFPEAKRIATLIRNLYTAPIIVGGPHITALPEDMIDSPFDVGIIGEGEETFLELLKYYDRYGEITCSKIEGLVFSENHRLIKTEPRKPIADIDSIPSPQYSLFAMRDYYTRPRILSPGYCGKGAAILSSRGCSSGDCGFCSNELMWDNQCRSFSAKRVFSEIKFLVNEYGCNCVLFWDHNFTRDKNWLKELAEYIKRSDFADYFSCTCESIPEIIDDERAAILRSMGCDRIEFTFGSGSQRVLTSLINPRASIEKNKEAITICHRHKIKILANFIFGGPEESEHDIRETIDFMQQHAIDFVAWDTLAAYSSSETTIPHQTDTVRMQNLYDYAAKHIQLENTHILHRRGLNKEDDMRLLYVLYKDIRALTKKNPRIYETVPVTHIKDTEQDSFLNKASHFIKTIGTAQRRLYYRDQSPQSLSKLYTYVNNFNPTIIVECGTHAGLSLRTFIAASTDARIVTIDHSFDELHKSKRHLPLDLSRVILIEKNSMEVDFADLYNKSDRVVFYVNLHTNNYNKIMEHILNNALPSLPAESFLIFDGIWHCPKKPDNINISEFFYTIVFNEIDPLNYFEGAVASYWKEGFFLGFNGIIQLASYLNRNGIEVLFEKGDKMIAFTRPPTDSTASAQDCANNAAGTKSGTITYHPLICCALPNNDPMIKSGMELYKRGEITNALHCFNDESSMLFAKAICYCRLGIFEKALPLLNNEKILKISPFAKMLLEDTQKFELIQADAPLTAVTSPHSSSDGAVTLFAVPKAFRSHTGIIQRNALTSWSLLVPKPEIILLGNEEGCAEIAKALNFRHIPDISCTEKGTPRVDTLFSQVENCSQNEIIGYINPDVIIMNDFITTINKVIKQVSTFLMIGQHWDLHIDKLLSFDPDTWELEVKKIIQESGKIQSPTGIEYCIFSKNLYKNIPPFALNHFLWDNWLVYQSIIDGNPVIDVTRSVTAVHQEHEPPQINRDEVLKNKELAGPQISSGQFGFALDATWELTDEKLKHRPRQLGIAASLRKLKEN